MGKSASENGSPRTSRDDLIGPIVQEALREEGWHWDLIGVEGIRPGSEIPDESWKQFPMISVALGERLCSQQTILDHTDASWLVKQIAMDLIWISGFVLVGSEIVEHVPDLVAPALERGLRTADSDTSRFDEKMIESHHQWCYCARMAQAESHPSPVFFAVAAESTLNIARLVLDLGIEHDLLSVNTEPISR